MRGLANGIKKVARRMILGVPDDGNPNAKACGRSALWHRFSGVVRALGVNVGAKVFEQRFNTRFAEDDDVVNDAESRNEKGPSAFAKDRAAGTFQFADAGVRVDAHDEDVAFTAGAFKITDVADVQRIKTPVGKNDALGAIFVLF
jgi:hypothetical protein